MHQVLRRRLATDRRPPGNRLDGSSRSVPPAEDSARLSPGARRPSAVGSGSLCDGTACPGIVS